jgi:polar amino acid transport system substrate-binding protein
LKTFASEVLTVLELDKLISLTEKKLSNAMKVESCNVVIGQVSEEAEVKIPITFKDRTIGMLLLGRKKSDEGYTQDDLDILQPLSKALGIAISNARLFEELSKARIKMAEKDKMATIGTLAAGMAHEIRNPITTIRNFADYLPEKYSDSVFMGQFNKLLPREIDRVEGIARSLLEFSSAEDTRSEERFAIDEPIKTVVSLLEPQYKASDIKILCDYKEKHVVKGRKIQFQDALFNILNYILAETQGSGTVLIECAVRDGRIVLSLKSRNLIVADHIMKDVFEPVSGLYKEKRGFGFNLFVAKQLLERNGMTLSISSDKTNGSEFKIGFGEGDKRGI